MLHWSKKVSSLSELDWNLCFHASFSPRILSHFSLALHRIDMSPEGYFLLSSCAVFGTVTLFLSHYLTNAWDGSQLTVMNSSCKLLGELVDIQIIIPFQANTSSREEGCFSMFFRPRQQRCRWLLFAEILHLPPRLKQHSGFLFEGDPFGGPNRELQSGDKMLFQRQMGVKYNLKCAQRGKAPIRTSLFWKSVVSVDRLKHHINEETNLALILLV